MKAGNRLWQKGFLDVLDIIKYTTKKAPLAVLELAILI